MAGLMGCVCSRGFRLWLVFTLCWPLLVSNPALAQTAPGANDTWQGRALANVLDELRAGGLPIIYSTNLVTPDLRVLDQPAHSEPLELLREILAPHELAVQQLDGMYLIVRAANPQPISTDSADLMVIIHSNGQSPAPETAVISSRPPLPNEEHLAPGIYQFRSVPARTYDIEVAAADYRTLRRQVELHSGQTEVLKFELELGPAELENLSVSASRYILFSNSQFFIDQRAIQALPDLGEDPIRSAHRLPGAAAGGLSSQSHFRGGGQDETAIFLNGLQLIDPFHIRNYNNIFSTIDARAISGVEAYTGGFPANYGDSMSGLLVLNSQRPDMPRHTELGASVYNTSALFSGYSAERGLDWLLSARRSNLDVFLSNDLGKPDYFDIFAAVGIDLSAQARLSFNGLYADDQVVVITESVPEELEQSISNSRNRHLWMLLENQWTGDLSSATVLSSSHLNSLRDAQVNDPDQYTGTVVDRRETDVTGLRQDWLYQGMVGHVLRWGIEIKHMKASYHYQSAAEYNEFFAYFPGVENPAMSHIDAAPRGNSYSLFVSDRWRLTKPLALQLGLRWDRQTYTRPTFSNQLSPRLSLLYEVNAALQLRVSWGRYYQSQGIHQLSVEDGLKSFSPAQRADHWIAGVQYHFAGDYRLRLEAFDKDYSRLKPRFENLFDKLALIPELEPDRVRLDPESARARGVEVSLEYRGRKEINWWLNWSWTKATDSIRGRDQPRSWDQRHAVQGGIAWTHGPWEAGAALNVHSGWPTTGMSLGFEEEEDRYFPIPGPRNGERVGTFATLDLRISRTFQVKPGELSVFFEVTNVTDRNNVCCLDFDLEEDSPEGPYLDRSKDFWLPVIPAAGILWEF